MPGLEETTPQDRYRTALRAYLKAATSLEDTREEDLEAANLTAENARIAFQLAKEALHHKAEISAAIDEKA